MYIILVIKFKIEKAMITTSNLIGVRKIAQM